MTPRGDRGTVTVSILPTPPLSFVSSSLSRLLSAAALCSCMPCSSFPSIYFPCSTAGTYAPPFSQGQTRCAGGRPPLSRQTRATMFCLAPHNGVSVFPARNEKNDAIFPATRRRLSPCVPLSFVRGGFSPLEKLLVFSKFFRRYIQAFVETSPQCVKEYVRSGQNS